MATVSFLKTISIKRSNEAKKLIKALENAKDKKSKDVNISRTVDIIDKKRIKEFFINS